MINKILNQLKIELETKFQNNFTGLVLFGSYAKNTPKQDSDIDILIVFKKLPKTRIERIELVEDILNFLEDNYKMPINPIIKEEKELGINFLIADIAEYSKIIIDKNKVILNLFNNIKEKYNKGLINKIILGSNYRIEIKNG